MRRALIPILLIICVFFSVSCSDNQEMEKKTTSEETVSETTKPKEKKPVKGIDVSSYSGRINWEKVKSSSVKFAVVRLGGRGYGDSGVLYTDKNADYNLTQAERQGIETGGYFFSQATSTEEAEEEARMAIKACEGKTINLPIAYDVERIKGDTSRIDNVKYSDSVKYAKTFMNAVKSAGYEPMVYIGEDSILKAEDFSGYKIWYADYGKPYNSGYEILQYSKNGKINGISGAVDLNVIYR